jgi:uroporphyrinogen decarboxylase
MNGRERMQTILRKETPDRMGLFEHFWGETLPEWVKQGYPTDEAGNPRPPHEVFAYDLLGCGPGVDTAPRRGFREVVEESEDWELVRTGTGALLRLWKHKSGTPEHVGFELTTRERWDQVKKPLLEFDAERISNLEEYRNGREKTRADGRFATTHLLFVFEFLRGSLGDVCMLESMLCDPEWIHDVCRVVSDCMIRHLRYAFEQAGAPDGAFVYEDLGYTNGLWASPKIMSELVMPYHKELVDFFHSQGLPAILHTCGDVRDAVDLIVDCGWDCLQPMEAKAGNDVVAFAEQCDGRMAFMGNINVMVLETGDRGAIRREIESKLIPLRERGVPYVFHSDHSIPPTIRYDSYRYALDVFRELADY